MSRGHGGARNGAGRPRLPEALARPPTILQRADTIQALLRGARLDDDYKALRLVFIRKTRLKVGHKAAKLIKDYARQENVAKQALQALRHPPKAVTTENALSILLHVDLSRQHYQTLRTLLNNAASFRNCLPSYELVRLYKPTCSPTKDVNLYTERRAEVKLQELLNHTAKRAVLSNQDNIIESVSKRTARVNCEFLITWGADGASEQSQYQQRHHQRENIGKSDNSLFAVVINPVILETKSCTCLWKNPAVQSYLFVRPLILEFEKETEAYVKNMKRYVDAQINALQPIDVELPDGTILRIRFKMLASMIDGKVFCYFVNKPFSSCPVCKATKSDLETYARWVGTEKLRPTLQALLYGLQVLHAWINFTNHLVKIPLRMARDEAKRDAAAAGLDRDDCRRIGKEAWNARLAQLSHEFRQNDLHLGMTVTGNLARTLFGPRRDLFESIVGIDRRIIDRFRIILVCINTTRYKLKPKEFQAYCNETRDLYLSLYPDFPLTPTLHKVFEHSVQIQEATGQILGEISEGAAEAKHRIRKQIRRYRARKTSRKDNLTDIMDRCLHLSDPKLSLEYSSRLTKYRDARRKHILGQIPQDAMDLLQPVVRRPGQQTPRGTAAAGEDHPSVQGRNADLAEDEGDDVEDSDTADEQEPESEAIESEQSGSEEDLSDDEVTDGNLTDDDDSSGDEDMFVDN